ncbi:MAG: tol-pal system YbgF family protein [Mangrovibacterium sp.]
MLRKSKLAEFIDKFLSGEMTTGEKEKFQSELEMDQELKDELNLYRQVEDAVRETDIMALREKLHHLDIPPRKVQPINSKQYSFSLREDLSSFRMMTQPVSVHDIKLFDEGLPILHLVQHYIAEKENIYELYRELPSAETEDVFLSSADQLILDDVEDAMKEKDIIDLRDNLQQIAENIPAHPYNIEEIDRYLNGELDGSELDEFNQELEFNSSLEKDILLYRETDLALGETDIMGLRATLQELSETETSTSRKMDEIERYLHRKLTEDELASFESEMESNPDLVAEVDLYRDIDAAIQEDDVMSLRARLDAINKDIIGEKQKEGSFITGIPRKKLIAVSVAASLILLLGINGIMHKTNLTNTELYGKYYTTYPGTGISRTSGTDLDNEISKALLQFNEKNYEESLSLFRAVLDKDANNPVGNFYSGMAYQETGQYEKAIASYKHVIKAGNNLFVDQAEWYSGLCYLQRDDRENAVRQLKKIAKSKNFYSEKALAILRKLKNTE